MEPAKAKVIFVWRTKITDATKDWFEIKEIQTRFHADGHPFIIGEPIKLTIEKDHDRQTIGAQEQ